LAAPLLWRCAGAGRLGIDPRKPIDTDLEQIYRAADAATSTIVSEYPAIARAGGRKQLGAQKIISTHQCHENLTVGSSFDLELTIVSTVIVKTTTITIIDEELRYSRFTDRFKISSSMWSKILKISLD
jgi:hypothetical protein